MNQANKAAMILLFVYFVMTTMNGNLRTWLQIIGLKG